jgi:hypothetical protein
MCLYKKTEVFAFDRCHSSPSGDIKEVLDLLHVSRQQDMCQDRDMTSSLVSSRRQSNKQVGNIFLSFQSSIINFSKLHSGTREKSFGRVKNPFTLN